MNRYEIRYLEPTHHIASDTCPYCESAVIDGQRGFFARFNCGTTATRRIDGPTLTRSNQCYQSEIDALRKQLAEKAKPT